MLKIPSRTGPIQDAASAPSAPVWGLPPSLPPLSAPKHHFPFRIMPRGSGAARLELILPYVELPMVQGRHPSSPDRLRGGRGSTRRVGHLAATAPRVQRILSGPTPA